MHSAIALQRNERGGDGYAVTRCAGSALDRACRLGRARLEPTVEQMVEGACHRMPGVVAAEANGASTAGFGATNASRRLQRRATIGTGCCCLYTDHFAYEHWK